MLCVRAAESREADVAALKQKLRSAHPRSNAQRQIEPTERAIHSTSFELGEKAQKYMEMLGLGRHWEPTDQACIDARKMQRERKYRKAIDHLEQLIVRRLFELQKFHVKGTSKLPHHYM